MDHFIAVVVVVSVMVFPVLDTPNWHLHFSGWSLSSWVEMAVKCWLYCGYCRRIWCCCLKYCGLKPENLLFIALFQKLYFSKSLKISPFSIFSSPIEQMHSTKQGCAVVRWKFIAVRCIILLHRQQPWCQNASFPSRGTVV